METSLYYDARSEKHHEHKLEDFPLEQNCLTHLKIHLADKEKPQNITAAR
jgi:hypothetical protein